jgi:hypothetical protein
MAGPLQSGLTAQSVRLTAQSDDGSIGQKVATGGRKKSGFPEISGKFSRRPAALRKI